MEQEVQPIIIKKVKKGGGGHHGGAWKVAYADFVTAMMAFFLLLWLLNVTTDEQKNAISNYFDPTSLKVSNSESGAGGVLGGMSMSTQGAMATQMQNPITVQPPEQESAKSDSIEPSDTDTEEDIQQIEEEKIIEAMEQMEEERFEEAKSMIEQAIQDSPDLKSLANNLIVDMTPEGLRIQIVDQEGKSMFPIGSARMYEKTKNLITKVAEIIKKLPNKISVRGHTDSIPYGKNAEYTNWELSTDRANSLRRVLLESGLPPERIHNVQGRADTEPLIADNPTDPRNRRISIILMKEDFALSAKENNGKLKKDGRKRLHKPVIEDKGYKETQGEVQFP